MKKMNLKKMSLMTLSFLGTSMAFAQDDPFSTINASVSGWIPGMKLLFNTIIILIILIGGLFVVWKMKTGEGSEGKKALMSFLGGLLFAVLIRVFLAIFGG